MALSFGCEVKAAIGAFMCTLTLLSLANTASAYTEKTLYPFCSIKKCADGAKPMGELAVDPAGNFYGTTYRGGNVGGLHNPGWGTVFEFAPSTGQYSVLYKFCKVAACADGVGPGQVKLVIDTSGNLYGATEEGGNVSGCVSVGCGVAFELVRKQSGWRERILYTFCSRRHCRDGAVPLAGLTYAGAAAGQLYDGTSPLYGTTEGGGENMYGGTVFLLTPKLGTKKWVETVLYSFCSQTGCADGAQPDSALFLDNAGNIYGTTLSGGEGNGTGTAFELSPSGTGYTQSVLYSFCSQPLCTDGSVPLGGVVMDGAGNLLGTTEGGGDKQDGLIFELSPDGGQWQYNVLASFDGSNGSVPEGRLLLDAGGNLFGTTYYGGGQGRKGTVFEFNGSIQTLYSFCAERGCPDGKNPVAGVMEDAAGNLFGTTEQGANHNSGTIYELSPSR